MWSRGCIESSEADISSRDGCVATPVAPFLRHTRALPRVSRRDQHQRRPHPTSNVRHPSSVAPNLIWGPYGGRWRHSASSRLRTVLAGHSEPLALRTGLGLGPKSSLGRRTLRRGVGAALGEIAAAERGNDGSWARRRGAPSRPHRDTVAPPQQHKGPANASPPLAQPQQHTPTKPDQIRPDPTTQNHPDQIGSSLRPAPNTPNRAEQT